jgi:hypothetical protein
MGKDYLQKLTGNNIQTIPGTTLTSEDLPAEEKSGMFSKFTNKEILAGGLAGVSALAQIGAGNSRAKMFEWQASQADVAGEHARQMGKDQENAIRSQYTAAQSSAMTSLAASGVKGGATANATLNALQRSESNAAFGALHTANMSGLAKKSDAAGFRQRSLNERFEGKLGAFGELSKFASKMVERGRPENGG